MDDDFLGASVWGTPASPLAIRPVSSFSPAPSSQDSGFDDFDEFGTPAETVAASGDEVDDDFGDFGDFGEPQDMSITEATSFEGGFEEQVQTPGPSTREWRPLRLDPLPSRQELQEQVEDILAPLWATIDMSQLADEDIRQMSGLNQTLVTRESRELFSALLPSTPPNSQPVNWTRSRIRRRHLISLGIPVNLDEVLPRANDKLPALEISTRPMSAPPGPRTDPTVSRPNVGPSGSRAGTPRPGTPKSATATQSIQLRLGPRPELDEEKASRLLALDSDKLILQPIAILERHLMDLQELTVNTSTLLTYLLQARDALQQDSETYNKLIGELVGEAQKVKTGKRLAGNKRSTLT